jgi:hypothetical protein
MKPETMAIVLFRVFGVITMLAGPVTFLRVPSMARTYSSSSSRITVSSSDVRSTNSATEPLSQADRQEAGFRAFHLALWYAVSQLIVQIVIGLILIWASRPLARLICRGVSESS